MRLTLIIFVLSAACSIACAATRSSSLEQLKKEFRTPSASYRALPMAFDQSKPAEYAAGLVDGHWGGALFNYSGPGYLIEKEGWDRFRAAVLACKKNGLEVWIYDEAAYPSGRAGGQTLDGHPELEARGLFYTSLDVHVSGNEGKTIEWKLPAGTPYYIAAFPLSLVGTIYGDGEEITDKAKDGVLKTDVRQGDWRLVAFVENRLYDGTHAPITTGQPYLNVLDPDAVKRFIELTHERYYANCGDEFGKTIKAFFTDEPSLQGGFLVAEAQPYPALSWYHGLPEIFKARNGYDIRKALPALFNDGEEDTVRYRCDWYSTLSQQIADAYFKQIREWCKAHNVASTGHLLWEESLVYHANFYGSVFPSLKELDWPGIDVLGCGRQATQGSHIEGGPVAPKLISSAAHIYGPLDVGGTPAPRRTMTESFCFVTKKEKPIEELIGHVSWQWVLGINSLSVLTIKQHYENEEFRRLNDFTGRVGSVLTQGDFVADVAVLYPIASVWADFVPTNRHVSYVGDQPKCREIDDAFRDVSVELLANQRDYDYLDEDAIHSAKIDKGTIRIGKNTYRILVLPHATVLRFDTLKQIAKFVDGGGAVISYKAVPTIREDNGDAAEFAELRDQIWDKATHVETLRALENALARGGAPDVAVSPRTRDIYYQHRALPSGDAYFISNNADKPFTGVITFRATGKAQVWDPTTGKTTSVEVKAVKGLSRVELTIPPLSGVFVVFER